MENKFEMVSKYLFDADSKIGSLAAQENQTEVFWLYIRSIRICLAYLIDSFFISSSDEIIAQLEAIKENYSPQFSSVFSKIDEAHNLLSKMTITDLTLSSESLSSRIADLINKENIILLMNSAHVLSYIARSRSDEVNGIVRI
jgi:hypothetical protein